MIKVKKAVWQSGQRAGLVIWWSMVKYFNSITLWICSWVSQVQLHAYSLYITNWSAPGQFGFLNIYIYIYIITVQND